MHSGEARAPYHADRQLTQTLTHNTPFHARTPRHSHTRSCTCFYKCTLVWTSSVIRCWLLTSCPFLSTLLLPSYPTQVRRGAKVLEAEKGQCGFINALCEFRVCQHWTQELGTWKDLSVAPPRALGNLGTSLCSQCGEGVCSTPSMKSELSKFLTYSTCLSLCRRKGRRRDGD